MSVIEGAVTAVPDLEHRARWLTLGGIGVALLMVVLDVTRVPVRP